MAARPARGRTPRWAAVGLFLVVVAVFLPTLGHDFVAFDDLRSVEAYRPIRDGLAPGAIRWAFSHELFANWIPVSVLSHMLDWELFGDAPAGHYATNVLLHAVTALLLFAFLRRATGTFPALVATLFFAVHPLRVESVAWLAERKDVLSGAFGAGALLLYRRYAETPGLFRWLGVAAALAAGLMAKPMLVTLPVVFLLLDLWPLERLGDTPSPRLLVVEKLPLLALSALAGLATIAVQSAEGAMGSVSLLRRAEVAVIAIATYLGKSLWPHDLSVFYPFPTSPPPSWQVAGATLLLAGITAGTFWYRRRCPHLLVGWLWFLVTLLPVLGLMQVGEQAMADRYTYLPSWGLSFALAGALARVPGVSWRRWAAVAAPPLLLLVLATERQLATWTTTETLFHQALEVDEGNWRAHAVLGRIHLGRGEIDDAGRHLVRALQLAPGKSELYPDVAAAFRALGEWDEARRILAKGLELDPDNLRLQREMEAAERRSDGADDPD